MAKFMVTYRFRGASSSVIDADSIEAAHVMVEECVGSDDFTITPDEVDGVEFEILAMHPITRAGSEIWATSVLEGDVRGHQSALKDTPLFADDPMV